jgi:hypothetical protein
VQGLAGREFFSSSDDRRHVAYFYPPVRRRGDRIIWPMSESAHATTDHSTPWLSFDAALMRGLTVISTS